MKPRPAFSRRQPRSAAALSSALLFLESIGERALGGQDLGYLQKARVALASLSNLLDTLLDVARLDSGGIGLNMPTFR